MLLISLLLPLPLQTTLFSLRIAQPLLLQLLSMLKVINSAPFSVPVPLKITVSCLEWIIHQANGLLPPRGLSQSFGTGARRSLHNRRSVEKAAHQGQTSTGWSSVFQPAWAHTEIGTYAHTLAAPQPQIPDDGWKRSTGMNELSTDNLPALTLQ